MSLFITIVSVLVAVVSGLDHCYWNSVTPYLLFASKTPYDAVRGDIRDYKGPDNCQALSIWIMNRHGNRYPKKRVIKDMKKFYHMKDEIIASHEGGNSKLCAQDIDDLRKWSWDPKMENKQHELTTVGFDELYNIGRRIREKYPHLLNGTNDAFYIRPTNENRTIDSAKAFISGFTEGTGLELIIDEPRDRDDVIRTYEYCDKYLNSTHKEDFSAYDSVEGYKTVRDAVQNRTGVPTTLTLDQIETLYELCRFYRSWSPTYKSPWCAVFSNEDLSMWEHREDINQYFRHGYGSEENAWLGGPAVKDMYETFVAAAEGKGKNAVAYFTHNAMVYFTGGAFGMYKDDSPLLAFHKDDEKIWRTSYITPFASNIISVLYSCNKPDPETLRIQIFLNEKLSGVCPDTGCTWSQFQEKFHTFKNATLDFCNLQ